MSGRPLRSGRARGGAAPTGRSDRDAITRPPLPVCPAAPGRPALRRRGSTGRWPASARQITCPPDTSMRRPDALGRCSAKKFRRTEASAFDEATDDDRDLSRNACLRKWLRIPSSEKYLLSQSYIHSSAWFSTSKARTCCRLAGHDTALRDAHILPLVC